MRVLVTGSAGHLGEDLRPGGANVSYLRHLVRLERELENFLKHHTEQRVDERPWCLVVNGDMVDFMSVMILPDADMALFHVTAEAENENKAKELVTTYVDKIKKWQG